MTLRVLIADDEPLARARLRALVQELGHHVCAEATDGDSAETALKEAHPDVLLLDIEMPGTNGLTVAKRARSAHPDMPVVLVTAHREHALEAFDAAVQDYVLKPVRKERLERALARVAAAQGNGRREVPMVRVTTGRKERLVPLNEIDCFVAEDGYVIARSARIEGFVDGSLRQLEETFPRELVRVHRACLAVASSIAGMETRPSGLHQLLFRDNSEPIEISRRRLPAVKDFLASISLISAH